MSNYEYEYYLDRCEKADNIVLTRIRNEEDIIEDFLNHVSEFADAIIVFDDSSTDKTLELVRKHVKVVSIIKNTKWDKNNRTGQETLHRRTLNDLAKDKFDPKWIIYMDADERLEGNVRLELDAIDNRTVDYIRISLFDAYMTLDDGEDILKGEKLLDRRKYYGPERRDIIFIWSGLANAQFIADDAREPIIESDRYLIRFRCQHLGKALSRQRWEDKCDYYINNFPDIYAVKWQARKGKAIHERSDFNTPLYVWGEELFKNAVVIHPLS